MVVADPKSDVVIWRVHPARERIVATASVIVVIAAAAWLTAESMGNPWWALLAVGFFLVTLHRFFFPSEYRIDGEGVAVRCGISSAKLRWADIRRFQHDDRSGLLSTRIRPSMRDAFQGIHLLFRGNRDEIVSRIESRIRTPDVSPAATPEVTP